MTEPCADRCTLLAEAMVELAQVHGRSERAERVAHGMSPEYVPPVPRATTSATARWMGQIESD